MLSVLMMEWLTDLTINKQLDMTVFGDNMLSH